MKIKKSKILITVLVLALLSYLLHSFFADNFYKKIAKTPQISEILSSVENGKTNLKKAKEHTFSGNFEESIKVLNSASDDFDSAIKELSSLDIIHSRNVLLTPTNSVIKILNAAKEGTVAFKYFNQVLWTLVTEKNIGKALQSLENVALSMDVIERDLSGLNLVFFSEYIKDKINEIKDWLDAFVSYRDVFYTHIKTLYEFCGMDEAKTYAVVLQNTSEARATGGFIGSIVIFTMQGGEVVSWDVFDTHLLDYLGGSYSPAPKYYSYIDRIALQEANFSPDVRISGKMIQYYLEEQGGPTVSSVIFLDDKILPFLLDLTGPLEVEGFPTKINKENYFNLIQYDLEKINISKGERVKNPKENYFNLILKIQSEIMKLKPNREYIEKILSLVSEKHIQIFSPNPDVQALLDELGFFGYFPDNETEEDFLAIVHSTFFNKSNRFLQDNIEHISEVYDDKVKNTLTIKRKHNYDLDYSKKVFEDLGLENETESFKSDLLDVLGRGDNQDLVRVFVPKGSVLIDQDGINREDIYIGEELSKTFFAFKMETKLSEEKDIQLQYNLPFKLSDIDDYKLYLWKQPGIDNSQILKKLIFNSSKDKLQLDAEINMHLKNDLIINANLTNNFLWTNKMLKLNQSKIKSRSKLKMKTAEEFMPMLLQ